jgi:hypothetical protein
MNRCCAAAWEQKLSDTIGLERTYKHPGAAAAASVSCYLIKLFRFQYKSFLSSFSYLLL